jgi:hypothetical protein
MQKTRIFIDVFARVTLTSCRAYNVICKWRCVFVCRHDGH